MAIRKKTTRRTEAKRRKITVTKTTMPTKTKTATNKRAMSESRLLAPQLITGARMLYLVTKIRQPLQHSYQKSSNLKRGVRSL